MARRTRIAAAALVAAALCVVGALAVTSTKQPADSTIPAAPIPARVLTDLDAAVKAAGAQRLSHPYAFGINDHTDGRVAYPTNPPTNGPHAPAWTADGNYAGRPAPPTEEVVHAQEHGRVVIQYRPGLARSALRRLVALYEESPHHVLLVENATDMPCDVAATAWGQAVLCRRVTGKTWDALRAFRDRFRDRGPEFVA